MQQDAEGEFFRENIPMDADTMFVVGMVFEGILHQIAASANVVESNVVWIMGKPIVQSLSVHLHQSVRTRHPDLSMTIHPHTIRIDKLAHQSLAIAEVLQVLHLIVQAEQSLVGGYPVIAFHIIQEAITLAAHEIVGHLQLSKLGHRRVGIEYLCQLREEHQSLMSSHTPEPQLRIEEAFREMRVLEGLRSSHIERQALRTSPSIAPAIKAQRGDTSTEA